MSLRHAALGLAGATLICIPSVLCGAAFAQEQLPWARPAQGTQARDDAYRPNTQQPYDSRYGDPSNGGGTGSSDRPPGSYDAYSPRASGGSAKVDDAYHPPRPASSYPAGPGGDAYSPARPGDYAQQPGSYSRAPGWTAPSQGYGEPYPAPSQGYNQPSSGYGQPYPPPPQAYNGAPAAGYGPGPYDRRYDPAPYNEPPPPDNSYSSREILDAGHGFFGSVSRGLANVIEHAFQQKGRPNGYILGQDAGGAFVAGLRYGEGILYTKDAGTHRVYWQGPSIGYDAGVEGSKVMMLVYNLHDPEDIYQRFGGVDGSAYVVGGVGMTYQVNGDIIVAPIRAGVGLRLGANIGYLKYTRRPTWNPF